MNKTYRTLSGFLILALAVGGAVMMVKNKPKAERKKMSAMIPVVTVVELQTANQPVKVEVLGKVIPDERVALRAEVRGGVTSLRRRLQVGDLVEQGTALFEIDRQEYTLQVQQAEAALQRAVSDLRLEEGRRAVAAHEMTLLDDAQPAAGAFQDIMLRDPQLKAAEAAVASAGASLEMARLNVQRGEVSAPFDAVVLQVDKYTGDYAQTGERLVELMATDRMFVRASLPVGDLKLFPNLGEEAYPVKLTLSDGNEVEGQLDSLLPSLSAQGGMAQVMIAVADPFGAQHPRPLLVDEVVRAEISGMEMEQVLLLERRYLRAGPALWLLDRENKLRILPVELLQGYAAAVLVRLELPEHHRLVTSNISAPVEGMALKAVEAGE